MPSLYEPCGLNQLYSMKYGTLPIVRATGGLEDTVQNYNQITGEGVGFKFREPTGQALYDTIGWAISTWFDRPHHIAKLRESAMAREFSWETAASKYVDVYRRAIQHRRAMT
jgi:starch synthase